MQVLMIALLIVIGVFLFGFVIFFHELGHFLVAKASGIRVNEFALGMGPKLFSIQKKETKYTLRLLPIGGFCAMEGEDDDSEDPKAFGNKPVWRRILVVLAGGVMNILLGFILMVIMLGQQNSFATTEIANFPENSALQAAGVQVGDVITKIDGYSIYTDRDLSFALSMANPDSIDFEVKRDGQKVTFDDVKMNSTTAEDGTKTITLDFRVLGEKKGLLMLLRRGTTDTFSMVRMVIETLKGMMTGRFGLNDLAGPVGTAQVIVQAAGTGLQQSFGVAVGNIIMMMIMITVNLGVVNLLPLPALDGGRLLFLLWELITRKPVPAKYESYIHGTGFILLIGLMVFITFNDIMRILFGI